MILTIATVAALFVVVSAADAATVTSNTSCPIPRVCTTTLTWSVSDGVSPHTFDISGPSVIFGGSGGSYSFSDSTEDTAIDASASGCTHSTTAGSHSFSCTPDSFDRMVVNLGAVNDTVRVNFCGGVRCLAVGAVAFPMTVNGFGGADNLSGGSGNDTLNGGDGDDTLIGAEGDDTLNGDNNSDTLNGGAGGDTLNAGTDGGNDTLIGGLGDDGLLDGGPGFDTVSYSDGRANPVTVTMGDGTATENDGGADDNAAPTAREAVTNVETLVGSNNADTLTGPATGVTIVGGGGDDTITGGAGTDTLQGEAGEDTLDGAGGQDDLSGGPDFDTVTYASRSAALTATIDSSFNDGAAGENDRIQGDVERIVGGSGPDSLSAAGAPGDVTLDGSGGDDTLTGGAFADTLLGGAGADAFDGAGGVDTVSYADHGAAVEASLAGGHSGDASDGAGDVISNVENLIGTAGDDTLIGDAGVNRIDGMAGNDTLQGGLGNDLLSGGSGFDTVDYSERATGQPVTASLDGIVNDGASGEADDIGTDFEEIDGGAGADTLSAAAVPGATLEGNSGNDALFAPNGGGKVVGGIGDDKLTGGDGPDVLDGGIGDDTTDGEGGSDAISGGPGNDSVESRDGLADSVDCGPDVDTALTDPIDSRVGCENGLLTTTPPVAGSPQQSQSHSQPQPAPEPLPALPRLPATVRLHFTKHAKFTEFTAFAVEKAPRGSKVTVTCRGSKCPLKKPFVKKKAHGTINVKSLLGKKLPPGTTITVTVAKPGWIGAVSVIKIRRGKAPSVKVQCLPPGAKKPSACGS